MTILLLRAARIAAAAVVVAMCALAVLASPMAASLAVVAAGVAAACGYAAAYALDGIGFRQRLRITHHRALRLAGATAVGWLLLVGLVTTLGTVVLAFLPLAVVAAGVWCVVRLSRQTHSTDATDTSALPDAARESARESRPRVGRPSGDDMALSDRDHRVLADIARHVRADDPDFAALLTTGRPRRRQRRWTPIWLRVLAMVLIATGMFTTPVLIVVAVVVLGIAEMAGRKNLSPSRAANPDDPDPPALLRG